MERVIGNLQRELHATRAAIRQLEEALDDRKATAEDLIKALMSLGGDPSIAACQEAERAWQSKVNAPSQQERARAPSAMGFIAGQGQGF